MNPAAPFKERREAPDSSHQTADLLLLMKHVEEHIEKQLDARFIPFNQKLDDMMTAIKSGVPNGDLDGHRRAHEVWLEEHKERKELRAKVMGKLAEGTAWAVFCGIVFALWYTYFGRV